MSRMVRKQVYIEPAQEAMLKQRAKERGMSEAELIRDGIDHVLRAAIVVPRESAAWEEEKRFIRKRMKLTAPQTGRTWTREELYDERLQRISH